jgi:hypothetical protein
MWKMPLTISIGPINGKKKMKYSYENNLYLSLLKMWKEKNNE